MTPTEFRAIRILLNYPNPMGGAEFGEALHEGKPMKSRQAYARFGGGVLARLHKKGWVKHWPVKHRHCTCYVASIEGKREYFNNRPKGLSDD